MKGPFEHPGAVFPLTYAGYLWLPKPKVAGSRPVVRFISLHTYALVERKAGCSAAEGFTGVHKRERQSWHLSDTLAVAR